MAPQGINTPEKCFVAIMAGAELGLPPFQALQSFAIINSRPTMYGDALVAVVRTNGFKLREWYEGEGRYYFEDTGNGQFQGRHSGSGDVSPVFDDEPSAIKWGAEHNNDFLTAFCEITRPDNGDTAEASFSVDDAKTAGLWKKSGPWTSNPKRMLKMRARAFAIRDGAADVLRGFQIREEVEDYAEQSPVVEKTAGTGLLAKLEAGQTLATEGFGIRDIDAEVTPEPKKRQPRKAKAADLGSEVLDAIAEAEPEIVQQVVEDHGGEYDAQVDVPALSEVVDGKAQAVELNLSSETVADGHAEPGEGYFHADKAAFPSGRRVWYVDGVEQKDTADDGTLPVYAEHAPLGLAQNEGQQASEGSAPKSAENAPSEPENPEITGFGGGAELDPFQTFDAAFAVSHSWDALRPHLVELGKSEAWRARPHDAVKVRQLVAEMIDRWNENGAKLDPAEDAWLFQCFVAGSDDVEAIQGTLALVQSAEWFTKASEAQQASIGRFAINRIYQIGGS